MKSKAIVGFLVCVAAATLSGGAWALDEAVLTTTAERSVTGTSAADGTPCAI